MAGKSRTGYYPELDGLRGIAILGVLAAHLHAPFAPGGFITVQIFFVLSGFLVTRSLLAKWERPEKPNLATFYARRVVKLLPSLLLLLVLSTLAGELSPDTARLVLGGMLNLAMVAGTVGPSVVDHLWYLSIEWQFLTFWPPLLLLLLAWRVPTRALLGLIGVAVVGVAVWRDLLWLNGASVERLYAGTDTRLDALLIGCAAALLVGTGEVARLGWPGRLWRGLMVGVAAFTLWLVLAHGYDSPWYYLGAFTVVALGVAALVVGLIVRPWPPLALALRWPPLAGLGRISYQLYLWHYAVVLALTNAFGWPLNAIIGVPLSIALALGCHVALERPISRLVHGEVRSKWSLVASGAPLAQSRSPLSRSSST